jgi:DNA-binding Xre family transcriptional regulator
LVLVSWFFAQPDYQDATPDAERRGILMIKNFRNCSRMSFSIEYIDKDIFKILFGKNLSRLRKNQNLSYRQLATRCNIDNSDLSKIEKGQRNISLSTILELSKGLDIHPKELFNFEFNIENH